MGQCAPLQINPCLELTVLGLPEATGKGLSKEIAHLYWFGGELQTSMGLRLDFLCDSVSPLKKKSSEMVGKPTWKMEALLKLEGFDICSLFWTETN